MKQTEILTHATHVNGWEPAVYMSCMSQNFRLFHVSNLSVRNFRIFLLMYTGSLSARGAGILMLFGDLRALRAGFLRTPPNGRWEAMICGHDARRSNPVTCSLTNSSCRVSSAPPRPAGPRCSFTYYGERRRICIALATPGGC